MLRVGLVGIGFMGWIHYLAYRRVRGIKVAAICSRDERKLAGDWRAIKGNFGPPGELLDLKGVATHRTIEAMLADPNVDVVDICLPPAMHEAVAIAALRAGKHVFCEKPIALSTAAADRMTKAAAKSGKQLLIAHVLPFLPEFAFVLQAVRSEKYGKLLGGHFKRIISDPLWVKDYYDAEKVGGPLLDLHIHDAHFIRLLCGMPNAITSRGRMRGEIVEFVETQFGFADPNLIVTASCGAIKQQGRSFTHAFEIYLEKATLLFDFAMLGGEVHLATPLCVLDAKGKVLKPELGSGDPVEGFVAEITEVVRSLNKNSPSPILDGQLARDAVILCQKQTQSVRSGKTVRV